MKHTKRAVSCGITALAMIVMLAGSSLSGNVTDTSQSSQQVNTEVVVMADSQEATKETKEKEITQVTTTAEPKTSEVATADPEWVDKLMANTEALNVRTEANADADLVGKLYMGSVAEILEAGDEWSKVKSGNVEGYVRNKYCVFGDDAKALAAEVCKTYATSKCGGLKVRYEATTAEDGKLLHVLEEGEKILVATDVEAKDGWVAVTYDNTTGYVSEAFVSVAVEYPKALTIAEEQEMERAKAAKARSASSSKSSSSSSSSSASYSELELLAALIYCEAGGESYEGQVAVGAVVMNRVESGSFPNSISGVIYQKGQFSPVASGKLSRTLANGKGSNCMAAAKAALAGEDNTGGCLYFNSGYGKGIQIGNQHFW